MSPQPLVGVSGLFQSSEQECDVVALLVLQGCRSLEDTKGCWLLLFSLLLKCEERGDEEFQGVA